MRFGVRRRKAARRFSPCCFGQSPILTHNDICYRNLNYTILAHEGFTHDSGVATILLAIIDEHFSAKSIG
jgi:hypothetical protein